ncbi:Ldh family oxidoreductase [Parablastomonas sp. CN1-191]|uniref:Ldh family oxidoreductase n=1 Tax=Parablastomonas sp. CN1-191 TaxID=3400908 RepID=UPI003BF850A8
MTTTETATLHTIDAAALSRFAALVYERAGLRHEDAAIAADSLVQADLWGHQTHGVMRLPWYVARLRSGAVAAAASPQIISDIGAVAVIDGHHAMGQVSAAAAASAAIKRAKTHGLGAVAVRNSNHFGTAMYFTLMAAREGCIGFLSTNASPAMPPWGGRAKAVGTNPWSWAAPAGAADPMVLDIANTSVARGKIYLARQKGQPIPLGWALDSNGAPTTDPVAALGGVTLPMAGHKGYGIAVMMDMLSGVLTGSNFGSAVNGPYQADKPGGAGHLMLALNIAAFQPENAFAERMGALIAELKAAPLAEGFEEILYPGEIEARCDRRLRGEGLTLPDDTIGDLHKLAVEMDCVGDLPI